MLMLLERACHAGAPWAMYPSKARMLKLDHCFHHQHNQLQQTNHLGNLAFALLLLQGDREKLPADIHEHTPPRRSLQPGVQLIVISVSTQKVIEEEDREDPTQPRYHPAH